MSKPAADQGRPAGHRSFSQPLTGSGGGGTSFDNLEIVSASFMSAHVHALNRILLQLRGARSGAGVMTVWIRLEVRAHPSAAWVKVEDLAGEEGAQDELPDGDNLINITHSKQPVQARILMDAHVDDATDIECVCYLSSNQTGRQRLIDDVED